MTFARGTFRCAVARCGGDADYALLVHARTSGGRRSRRQTSSGTIRLCEECANSVKAGKVPIELVQAFQKAMTRIKELQP